MVEGCGRHTSTCTQRMTRDLHWRTSRPLRGVHPLRSVVGSRTRARGRARLSYLSYLSYLSWWPSDLSWPSISSHANWCGETRRGGSSSWLSGRSRWTGISVALSHRHRVPRELIRGWSNGQAVRLLMLLMLMVLRICTSRCRSVHRSATDLAIRRESVRRCRSDSTIGVRICRRWWMTATRESTRILTCARGLRWRRELLSREGWRSVASIWPGCSRSKLRWRNWAGSSSTCREPILGDRGRMSVAGRRCRIAKCVQQVLLLMR